MTESEIQQLIQLQGPSHNCILMRNNSGAFKDNTGRLVRFGLGHITNNQSSKSSDLIGVTIVQVTPEMVGQHVAIFTAVEVKQPGAKVDGRYKKQKAFVDWIKNIGGIAGICSSVEEFKALFKV